MCVNCNLHKCDVHNGIPLSVWYTFQVRYCHMVLYSYYKYLSTQVLCVILGWDDALANNLTIVEDYPVLVGYLMLIVYVRQNGGIFYRCCIIHNIIFRPLKRCFIDFICQCRYWTESDSFYLHTFYGGLGLVHILSR